MNENPLHKRKDRIGLLLILAYLTLCFVLVALDSGEAGSIDTSTINQLKMFQVIGATLIFILPVTSYARFFHYEKGQFLKMHNAPKLYYLLASVTVIFFALPAVSGIQQWNAQLHLPDSLSNVEAWMQNKERAAEEITSSFFTDKSTFGLITNLIVVALIAALSEEIFFRGALQQSLQKSGLNLHAAVWISAILFSAFHLQFFGFFPRLLLGGILGYLFAITGNLWVSIAAHFTNNAFAVIAMHMSGEEFPGGETINENYAIGVPMVLLSLVLVAGQLFFLQKRVKAESIGTQNNL